MWPKQVAHAEVDTDSATGASRPTSCSTREGPPRAVEHGGCAEGDCLAAQTVWLKFGVRNKMAGRSEYEKAALWKEGATLAGR